jgi:hypothetical protein
LATTSARTTAWHGLARPAAAFAACLAGSIGLVAYALVSESALALEVLVGSLVVLGIVAGILAPSWRGLLAALAGGWIGLLGYGVVYAATHADEAEAAFTQGTYIILATVLVPVAIGPGVLVGATVVWGTAAVRRRLASGG